MPQFSVTENAINAYVLEKLRAAGCVRGRLEANGKSARLSLSGQRPDGQSMFFWELEAPFARLMSDYLEAHMGPEVAQFLVTADVEQGTCRYSRVTWAEQAAAAQHKQQEELVARQQRPRRTTPYGPELAGRVADALVQGRALSYYHREYCGMGLDYADGHYRYGEVWDSYLDPKQTFASRETFVAWLAQQSDKTLARLEESESWLWDNQTVTRQRLEQLVAP